MQDTYFTVSEFAKKFKISTTLVYRLIKEGEIPAISLGERNYRISPQTVDGIENSGLFDSRQ
jgi:excisionase family DNA binding protein